MKITEIAKHIEAGGKARRSLWPKGFYIQENEESSWMDCNGVKIHFIYQWIDLVHDDWEILE